MQVIGFVNQQPVSLGSGAIPGLESTAGLVRQHLGAGQAQAGAAQLASAISQLANQLQSLASQLPPTSTATATSSPQKKSRKQKSAKPASSYADPRVSDARARTNEALRQKSSRVVVSEGRGHTLRQVADRNLALQGWGNASSKQVAQETKRLGALNGIKSFTHKIHGRVVVSDNGMSKAEATKLRHRLNAQDHKAGKHTHHPASVAQQSGDAAKSNPKQKPSAAKRKDAATPAQKPSGAQKATGGGDIPAANKLTVKGRKMSSEQRRNLDAVLDVGKRMGASDKVQKAAVATVIQESNAQNLKHGDRDSLGLFQQRPSMGWGSPTQVRDPAHAARKFYEQAIPADKKAPGKSITQLAQTVQRSGHPTLYQQWAGEATKIVQSWKSS